MDKKEFIEKFASSESMRERNKKATEMNMGMVKFDYVQDIPSIDFCEVCLHPKGWTMNVFEMCTSFDGADIPKLVEDFKDRSGAYFEGQTGPGENCQLVLNLVIPPEPKMIMELGNHIDTLMKMDIAITVYDPETDRRGSCLINEEFFASLKEDGDYAGMDDSEIFTNFLMNFVEML